MEEEHEEEAVQELLKRSPKEVPSRFVQAAGWGPKDRRCVTPGLEIPVIDMSQDRGTMLQALKQACQEWGFFQVLNHGVDQEVVRKLRKLTYEFYMMPAVEKEKWGRKKGTSAGYGPFKKSSDGTSDWIDSLCMYVCPESACNVATAWPDKPKLLRYYVGEAGKKIGSFAHILSENLCESLALPPDHMTSVYANGVASIRLNFYPCCPFADQVLGVGAHSDIDTFTVLIEESDKEGLEVLKDGVWVPVKPLEGAFIVNVGDVLQVISNGMYKSRDHRALVSKHTERVSIVVNYSPSHDVTISPAQKLLDDNRPAIYRQSKYLDYVNICESEKSIGRARVDSLLVRRDE